MAKETSRRERNWGNQGVWLRRSFEPNRSAALKPLALYLRADEDVEVYINGELAAVAPGSQSKLYKVVECRNDIRLLPG